jgi:predicted DNA-binding transcriptional regulator AlpA
MREREPAQMSNRKLADDLAYPPGAMRLERAARYLDMSTSTFLRLVDDGELPAPTRKNGIVSWDRLDLDATYENWKTASGGNSIEKLLRDGNARNN